VVQNLGLLPLKKCSYETTDKRFLSSFIERWHHKTNTFHLTLGEITIALDDVSSLVHIPIVGGLYSYPHTSKEVVITLLMELLGVDKEDAFLETKQCREGHVHLSCLQVVYVDRCGDKQWDQAARAYLLHLVACSIFIDKSWT